MAQVIQLSPAWDQQNQDLTSYLLKQIEVLLNKITVLEEAVNDTKEKRNSVWLNLREGMRQICFDDVAYCKAESNYTHIHFVDGSKVLVSMTMKAITALFDDNRFIRAHQSFLVNGSLVTKFASHESELTLKGGCRIPVSRANHRIVRDLLIAGEH